MSRVMRLTGRIGWGGDQVTAEAISQFVHAAPRGSRLTFELDLEGGLVGAANACARSIRAHRGPTEALVKRRCWSAGTIILCGCQYRLADASSTFFFHGVSSQSAARHPDLVAYERAGVLAATHELAELLAKILPH